MNLEALVIESKNRNETAQKKLFSLYYQRSLIYCILLLKNRLDAEDVSMISWNQFFKHLKNFDYRGGESIYNWLKTIIQNECKKLRRYNKNCWNFEPILDTMDVTIPEASAEKVNVVDLLSIIQHIRKEYMAIFIYYELDGMSHKEIAAECSISESTSRAYLCRAKNQIQLLLTQKKYAYEK